MKIRFFDKETGAVIGFDEYYFIDEKGDVYVSKGPSPDLGHEIEQAPEIGWEIVRDESK
jgi:hypothetical protein